MAKNYIYEDMYKNVVYWAVNNDANGNPRYVVHFTELLSDEEEERYDILEGHRIATERAKQLHGRIYRAEWFGGGIIFTTHDIKRKIDEIVELRTNKLTK